ncbi:hypothetical protein LCL96_14665 [Rossellomorea aquimaris]|uniref:hypothetical protein n=1 Tax=Rossellomorea TaxID=2837508 RepID=UPI001CD5CD81|nr:hypothetical protein [Rossellomorea aquimaris]MCA1060178.1 hypothetical protein [Rossellomorea aquimaris]
MKSSRFILIYTFFVLMSGCYRQLSIEMVAFNHLSQEEKTKIPVSPKDSDVEEVTVGKGLGKHIGEKWIGRSIYKVAFNGTEDESLGRLVVYIDKDQKTVIGKEYERKE